MYSIIQYGAIKMIENSGTKLSKIIITHNMRMRRMHGLYRYLSLGVSLSNTLSEFVSFVLLFSFFLDFDPSLACAVTEENLATILACFTRLNLRLIECKLQYITSQTPTHSKLTQNTIFVRRS